MPNGRKTQTRYNGNGEFAITPAHPEWFLQRGLRVADLLISIDKGKSSEISKQIFADNRNVVFITGRVNVVANVIARVYFTDSMMLRDTIESVKSIAYVSRVEFTEVVEIFGRRPSKQIEEDVKKLLNSSGRNW
jgi:hypothetical protein